MTPVEAIVTRRSATRLGDPAPADAELLALLEKAMTAPDHGLLRPWRLVLVREAARSLLGEAFARQAREAGGDAVAAERAAGKALRAPLLVSIVFRPHHGHKVAEWEQLAATSAMVQNLSLLLHVHHWASIWRTGQMTVAPPVREVLGIEPGEQLLGWLYVGTPEPAQRQPVPRPAIDPYAHVSRLTGQGGLHTVRRCHVG